MGRLTQAIKRHKLPDGTWVTDTFDYLNDGRGYRVERRKNSIVQQRYIYDQYGRIIEELRPTDGTLLYHYVYATKSHVPDYMINKNGVKFKLIHDHLGSVRMVVNTANGVVKSQIDYTEFGQVEDGAVAVGFQPFGFAGGIYDTATGLVRFGARDYDPVVGRWTAKDPILFEGGDVNLYGYTWADPVNFIDPAGLRSDLICRAVGGSGGTAGGMHCYIRVTPEPGSGLGTAPMTFSLLTPDGRTGYKYIDAPEDSGKGSFSAPINNGRCNTSAEQDRIDNAIVNSFNRQQNGTPYNPLGANSNAFVRRVLEGAGLRVLPRAPVGAVGY